MRVAVVTVGEGSKALTLMLCRMVLEESLHIYCGGRLSTGTVQPLVQVSVAQ